MIVPGSGFITSPGGGGFPVSGAWNESIGTTYWDGHYTWDGTKFVSASVSAGHSVWLTALGASTFDVATKLKFTYSFVSGTESSPTFVSVFTTHRAPGTWTDEFTINTLTLAEYDSLMLDSIGYGLTTVEITSLQFWVP